MVIIISYNKQTWKEYNDNQTAHKNLANGAIISADKLNHMETGISNNDTNKVTDNKNGSIQVNGSSITPADDSKVVHSTDMRKPASDVVGLEDVPNGLYRGNLPENTDLSALTQEGIYNFATTLVNFIDSGYHWGTIQVINKSNVVSQCIICTSKFGNLGDQIFFRTRSGGSKTWHPWTMIPRFSMDNLLELPNGELLKPANDSKVVHSTDMRKPASDVAGIEEVNAKQDKIGYTPADDSKVVHSKDMRKPASDVAGIEEVNTKQDKIDYTPADDSKVPHNSGNEEIAGQKTFDVAPIDKKTGNPYITKSDAPKVDLSNYATQQQLATKADDSTVLHNNNLDRITTDDSGIVIGNEQNFGLIKRSGSPAGIAVGSGKNFRFMATNDAVLSNKSGYHDVWNIAPNGQMSIMSGAYFTPADDSKVVHSTDMRKPASDVAGIEEVNTKQDKIGYTPADDSKVAHLSGKNNFDTVPTVNNNPLLLASSLPSDLARTGSNQEFTGKNTFDTAPIDKTTGNPYITKDGVPAISPTLADTTKDANFTGKLQKSGIDVATTTDVTKAVNTATSNSSKYIKASKNNENSAISDSTKGNSNDIYYWCEN